MARRERSPEPTIRHQLETQRSQCVACGGPLWVAYHKTRTISTLQDVAGLTLAVRRCQHPACPLYHQPYRPEEEGHWALPRSTFGLDVIALVGRLRYAEHRSVPEIHRHLVERGVRIAERTVTHLVYRYEELLAVHLADAARRVARMQAQGRVLLALDGLQPDVGHEVLGVLRECLSGEVLLARSLLSSTGDDLAALLREVIMTLPVPVAGVISDGQHPIRDAVATVLPGVPHQLCQFHYLREAARPLFEADRHAKKELKKRVRGVRPIERAVEGRTDAEAAVVRGYCLAVRSALTDDGRPPLCAAVRRGPAPARAVEPDPRLGRTGRGKRGAGYTLRRVERLLGRGLAATADAWPAIRAVYAAVYRAADLLANHDAHTGAALAADYQALVAAMTAQHGTGPLAAAVAHFAKVTASYAPGLFHCYDVDDLPRTNNDLEQFFGAARYHERRATGRRNASPGLVVRGAVRLVAAVVTPLHPLSADDLRPRDLATWRTVRQQMAGRQDSRRAQSRFRKDPAAYLAALEAKVLMPSLPP